MAKLPFDERLSESYLIVSPMKNFADLPGFTLRELGPADIAAFIELGLPTCAFMHGRPETSPQKFRQNFTSFVREYAFDSESQIYVVEAPDGTIAAQMWLHTTRNRFNGLTELWVWDVTVRENFQRKGLGKHLLNLARKRAGQMDCAELWLLVSGKNDKAIRLYESIGMHKAGHLMALSIKDPEPETRLAIDVHVAALRPLKQEDVRSLYKLWTASGLPFKPRGRDSVERLSRHLSGSMPGGWGMFDEDTLTAAALISYDGRKGYVERLATRPEYRRTGLAKTIVTACLTTLREAGALVTAALIESNNSASRKLFESLGFIHKPEICYYTLRNDSES